jgi:hypothetical protein
MNLRKFYLGRSIGFIVVFVLLLLVWYIKSLLPMSSMQEEIGPDVKNIVYQIEGQSFALRDGQAENIDQASGVKNKLSIFGEPTWGDVDGDGDQDAALILLNEPGGSGTFYYAALAIKIGGGYTPTNSLLLGDRIAPQTVEIRAGQVIYNYADRKPDEPMVIQPSFGQSLYLQYDQDNQQISIKPSEAVFCTMESKLCPGGSYVVRSGPKCEFAVCPELKSALNEKQARDIAEATCIKGGESLAPGIYNAGTKTWWFDANLNATKDGCNPACVVNEDSKKAEINWRCTGLLNEVNNENSVIFCTMDAKECPDGSWVGRSGPNCEFTPCP